MIKAMIPLVVLIAAVVVAAGCGGDDDGGSEDGASATAPATSTSPDGSESEGSTQGDSDSDSSNGGSKGGDSGSGGSGGETPGDSSAGDAGTGNESSAAPSRSKVRFLKQANGICGKTKSNLNREGDEFVKKQGGKKPPQELFGEVAEKVLLPAIEDENAAIGRLKPPKGEAGEVEAILSTHQEGIDEMRSLLDDPSTLPELERPFDKANEEFRAYGLIACVM